MDVEFDIMLFFGVWILKLIFEFLDYGILVLGLRRWFLVLELDCFVWIGTFGCAHFVLDDFDSKMTFTLS